MAGSSGLVTFGMEIEIYVRPKQSILSQLEENKYIADFPSSYKNENLKAVLKTLADILTEGNIATIVDANEGENAYKEWQVKHDPSLTQANKSGYCQ